MNHSAVRKLIGQQVYAVRKKGGQVCGKLVKVSGSTIYIQPVSRKGKKVRTSAIIPLVLFDLLAVGTIPYGYGANPYNFYGAYGGYPYGAGYPRYY